MSKSIKKLEKDSKRNINPEDILLPKGYGIDVFMNGLTTPINLIYSNDGNLLVADSGVTDHNGKVFKISEGNVELIADGFNSPLTGITSHDNGIYVSHRGAITLIKPDGTKQDIITGLPSWGDHHNNKVIFGPDNKMYFGQGTATNSGVVGEDNSDWVKNHPYFHDYPGCTIILNGNNFKTNNYLSSADCDNVYTGAFSPFGVNTNQNEIIKGIKRASGSILRANPDGSELELIAWGLRNPFRIKFDKCNRLLTTNHGMDIRGSRPVANSPDEIYQVFPGAWYGWPDFSGGIPITSNIFKPDEKPQPQFLLKHHPMVPPRPISAFAPHSAIMGFDISNNNSFGDDQLYIAEFGSEAPRTTGGKPLPGVGHRVSRVDLHSGNIYPFAINKSGFAASFSNEGGLERPIDILLGNNDEMYIVDFGLEEENGHHGYMPNTGVIWRIKKI